MFGPKRTWSFPLGFPMSDGKNPEFSHGFSGQQSPAQGAGDGLGDRRHGGGGGDATTGGDAAAPRSRYDGYPLVI